ncbi:MAG: uncharacterized protein QOH46_170 [Solirubrobacteraceae bacterium]|jgi:uncharacterized protein YcgI (DUF1989 family)|nr:uncharacterized protein [Solirubrobacteraceae bacterium]
MSTSTSTIVIPAREGRALVLQAGERLRLTTPHGRQAVDFFAFVERDLREWLSPMHTWMATKRLHPRQGDTFLTRHRNPIVQFVEDGAGGVHDMLLAACDANRYRSLGFEGRRGCGDNLVSAMADLGYETDMVPQPVNFFTSTEVGPDMTLMGGPNPVPPGGYVVLEALVDIVCTASACPWDLSEPWPVNAPEGLSEITAEVVQA